jgi:hypothetical protein
LTTPCVLYEEFDFLTKADASREDPNDDAALDGPARLAAPACPVLSQCMCCVVHQLEFLFLIWDTPDLVVPVLIIWMSIP